MASTNDIRASDVVLFRTVPGYIPWSEGNIPLFFQGTNVLGTVVGWYIIFMASEGGGGEVVGRWWSDGRYGTSKQEFGPWFKSRKSLKMVTKITIVEA